MSFSDCNLFVLLPLSRCMKVHSPVLLFFETFLRLEFDILRCDDINVLFIYLFICRATNPFEDCNPYPGDWVIFTHSWNRILSLQERTSQVSFHCTWMFVPSTQKVMFEVFTKTVFVGDVKVMWWEIAGSPANVCHPAVIHHWVQDILLSVSHPSIEHPVSLVCHTKPRVLSLSLLVPSTFIVSPSPTPQHLFTGFGECSGHAAWSGRDGKGGRWIILDL